MRIGITTSATFKSKTYVAGATKANMSGAITGDTPEAFVEALRDVNDNHAKDDIESALDYISDAKCEFVNWLTKCLDTGLPKRVSFIELLSNCVASFFQNRNSTAWQISLKILYVRNSKHHCPGILCQMVEQRLLTLV